MPDRLALLIWCPCEFGGLETQITASDIAPNAGPALQRAFKTFKPAMCCTFTLSLPCVAGHHGHQLVPVLETCLKAATSPWTGAEPYRTLVKFPALVKFWRQSQKFFLSNLELCHPDRLALLIWCGPCEFGGLETQILPLVATASGIGPNAGLQSRPPGLKIILQSFKTFKLSLPCVAECHQHQLSPRAHAWTKSSWTLGGTAPSFPASPTRRAAGFASSSSTTSSCLGCPGRPSRACCRKQVVFCCMPLATCLAGILPLHGPHRS